MNTARGVDFAPGWEVASEKKKINTKIYFYHKQSGYEYFSRA